MLYSQNVADLIRLEKQVLATDKNGDPHVAVKELTSVSNFDSTAFAGVAKNELGILEHFRRLRNLHLITTIAYYSQLDHHYFVFPWAHGGNLRNFWEREPSLSPNSLDNISHQDWCKYLNWAFKQLAGIVAAIKELHDDEGVGGCRHGDLKPENILCFCKRLPSPGEAPTSVTLVVADAGLAKIHANATEKRFGPTETQRGTTRYSPPEADVRDKRSRRYDIWSLGCLFLEFLIWLLYGNNGLKDFRNDVEDGFPFYETTNHGKYVKSAVVAWIEKIRDDPRCFPTSLQSTVLGRVVDLVESRMLVVNVSPAEPNRFFGEKNIETTLLSNNFGLPDTGRATVMVTSPTLPTRGSGLGKPERADAREMCREMNKIIAKAEIGEIKWINWEGMEEAARLGRPQIPDLLMPHHRSQLGRTSSNNQLNPSVRDHHAPIRFSQLSLGSR